MSLSPENSALVERTQLAPNGFNEVRSFTFENLNRLLDAARAEGWRQGHEDGRSTTMESSL